MNVLKLTKEQFDSRGHYRGEVKLYNYDGDLEIENDLGKIFLNQDDSSSIININGNIFSGINTEINVNGDIFINGNADIKESIYAKNIKVENNINVGVNLIADNIEIGGSIVCANIKSMGEKILTVNVDMRVGNVFSRTGINVGRDVKVANSIETDLSCFAGSIFGIEYCTISIGRNIECKKIKSTFIAIGGNIKANCIEAGAIKVDGNIVSYSIESGDTIKVGGNILCDHISAGVNLNFFDKIKLGIEHQTIYCQKLERGDVWKGVLKESN